MLISQEAERAINEAVQSYATAIRNELNRRYTGSFRLVNVRDVEEAVKRVHAAALK